MANFPKIHVTKSGKRYFVVKGRKVYITAKMTKREITRIYKLLKKNVGKKTKVTKATNINKASAVIKQYINTPRTRSKAKPKARPSTIDPEKRVTTSSGDARHPKDSGDKDLINSLINKLNGSANKPTQLIDYSVEGRLLQLQKDPDFLRLQQNPNAPEDDFVRLAEKYGLLDYYYALKHKHELNPPDDGSYEGSDDGKHDRESLPRESDDDREDFNDIIKDLMKHKSGFESKEAQPENAQDEPVQDVLPNTPDEGVDDIKSEQKSRYSSRNQATEEFSNITSQSEPASQSQRAQKFIEIEDIDDIGFLKRLVNRLRHNRPTLKKYIHAIPANAKNLDHYRDVLQQEMEQLDDPEAPEAPVSNFEFNKAYRNTVEQIEAENEALRIKNKNAEMRRKQRLIKSAEKAAKTREGKGRSDTHGLYDDEIDKIMSHFKDFHGCIMRDEIKNLLPQIRPQSRVAFIINNQDHNSPGQHWDAVYIDARNGPESSNSLEWFDSFARPMPADIREDCKLILKCLKPETILKLKENRIIHQSDESSNCGYFCCRFLIDRFRGKSFSAASGFDDRVKIDHSKQEEKEIEKMKKYPPFNYVLPD